MAKKRVQLSKPSGKAEISEEARATYAIWQAGKESAQNVDLSRAARCARCGCVLNETTGVYAPKGVFHSGWHPVCLSCQQLRYESVAKETSRTYALFYLCMAYDVPYLPDTISECEGNPKGTWTEYVQRVQHEYLGQERPSVKTWTDGITDIAEAFGGDFPVLPITGDVMVANLDELPDKERWKIEWGEAWSESECREMDNRYMQLTSEWRGTPVPPRTAMSLHDVVRNMMMRDNMMRTDASAAKKYQDMINAIMASEDLKVQKDRQNESIRVDKLTQRLEEKGAIKNGQIVGREELAKILAKEKGTYNTSLDVVDMIIFNILNTMRKNMGQPEFDVLPLSAQVTDFKGELLETPSEEEKRIMQNIGQKPPLREGQM